MEKYFKVSKEYARSPQKALHISKTVKIYIDKKFKKILKFLKLINLLKNIKLISFEEYTS